MHQGGPACEGLTIAKVEERLRPDKTSMGLYFSEEEMHFVCPWHGMEYDMKTGECVADRKLKLKKYKTCKREKTSMSSPKARGQDAVDRVGVRPNAPARHESRAERLAGGRQAGR